jgi:hypothetical protein
MFFPGHLLQKGSSALCMPSRWHSEDLNWFKILSPGFCPPLCVQFLTGPSVGASLKRPKPLTFLWVPPSAAVADQLHGLSTSVSWSFTSSSALVCHLLWYYIEDLYVYLQKKWSIHGWHISGCVYHCLPCSTLDRKCSKDCIRWKFHILLVVLTIFFKNQASPKTPRNIVITSHVMTILRYPQEYSIVLSGSNISFS